MLAKYNLEHEDGETDDDSKKIATLKEYNAKLGQDVKAKQTQVAIVEKDLNRLERDLQEAEKSHRDAVQTVEDYRRKSALIKLTALSTHSSIELLDEIKNRLALKAQHVLERSQKKSTKMYIKENSGDATGKDNVETACTKAIRGSCLQIGSFLTQLLHGKFADSVQTLTARKDTLQTIVNDVCEEFPPTQIVVSLSVYAQDTTIELREKTARVDVRKDAERLRFKYDGGNGSLQDAADTPNVIATVSSLVEEAHRDNIRRFMVTEKSRNNAAALDTKLRFAKQPLMLHLSRSYRGNPNNLELAKKLFEAELQVAVTRGNIQQLDAFAAELNDKIGRAVKEKEMLHSRYEQIQDFARLVERKQNLIRVLVRQNLNAAAKLGAQQRKIIEFMQKSLCVHEPETRSHTADLTDTYSREIELFSCLALPQLMYVTLRDAAKVSVIELSINRSRTVGSNSSSSSSGGVSRCSETIGTIRALLDCPAYLGAECLARDVCRLKNELADIDDALQESDFRWDSHVAPLIRLTTSLCEELRQLDKTQLAEVGPVLQKRVALATQSLTDCLNVKDAIRCWWEQPAQHITPWLKVDDITFQQWRDKFTVLATRIRQMQLK